MEQIDIKNKQFAKIITVDEENNKYEANLSFNNVTEIKKRISLLKRFRELAFLNYNVKESCSEYLSKSLHSYDEGTIHFAEINRLLLTILSSFYTYISFCVKNFDDSFSKISKKIYDDNYEYRLLFNLRRYMEHNGLVLEGRNTTFNSDSILVDYYALTKTLIDSKSIQSSFRKELLSKGIQTICLKEIIENFGDIIDDVTIGLISFHQQDLIESFRYLSSIIPHYYSEKKLCFIEETGKEVKYSPFKVMTMTIEALSRCFVYRMIEEKKRPIIEDRFSFFRILCAIYYGDENSIPSEKSINSNKQ
ncbi:MAG TPA: hypothetical protein PKC96_06330 [Bacilli bacterium]|nr:hypothetical protein [Bacilli bacterium]